MQEKANIGDKGEISLPDMAYTCRHRGMKEFKIRSDGMPLSNQLTFPHYVSPPLYGPHELSESSQAPSLYSPSHPSALPRRNKDNAWSMFLSLLFFSLFSHFFPPDPRDPCRFLPPAFLTGYSVRLSSARTVFPSHYPFHTSSHPHISLSA